MKTLFLFVVFHFSFSLNAQTWRSVDIKAMNPFTWVYTGGGTNNNRYFRINPYNNDIWLTYQNAVQVMDHNGDYRYYNNSNTPSFPASNVSFRDFAFTPEYTFALSGYYGLYQLDGNDWNLAIPFDEGINLAYDADTIWCVRTNENYMKWYGGFNSTGSHTALRKAEIKRGLFWVANENSSVIRYENNVGIYYSSNSSTLMDSGNWDMKFYPGTDSLFVANDAGFAIADGITFIDSICAANCTNMPNGIILEFEFDADNNIWALIGNSSLYYKDALVHYDVSSKTWDQYYDENNSPLSFNSPRMSIEMDNLGNLWVADQNFLHVLDEGSAPQWVGMEEYNAQLAVSVSPNPAMDVVSINFEGQQTELKVCDAQGKTIHTSMLVSGEQFSLSGLESGVYFFELVNEKGKATKRIVKH